MRAKKDYEDLKEDDSIKLCARLLFKFLSSNICKEEAKKTHLNGMEFKFSLGMCDGIHRLHFYTKIAMSIIRLPSRALSLSLS